MSVETCFIREPLSSTSWCSWDLIYRELGAICTSIVVCVLQALETLALVFQCKWDAIEWNHQNKNRFTALPLFTFRAPPPFSKQQNDPLIPFLIEFRTLEGLSTEEAVQGQINKKLAVGYCHGQGLALLEGMQSQSLSLHEALKKLSPQRVTHFQVIECLRECFQRHRRTDLLEKLDLLMPGGFSHEVAYTGKVDEKTLLTDLLNQSAYVTVRVYNQSLSHTFFLEVDAEHHRFGFYNSAGAGLFQYDDCKQLSHAFLSHATSHLSFLSGKDQVHWDFDFYRLKGEAS